MASGRPSSLAHKAATAATSAACCAGPGSAARARSRNSRTAGAPGPLAASGLTCHTCSPSTSSRFPAGRQQDDVAGLPQEPLGEDGDGMRDVLALVENEQHVPARQLLDELIVEPPERPLPEPCRGGDGP